MGVENSHSMVKQPSKFEEENVALKETNEAQIKKI